MYRNRIYKLNRQILTILAVILCVTVSHFDVKAMEDGVYTVSRTTSYPNPETGLTADGGSNIALGNSMCDSIVESSALIEQTNGKTYVTIGIGLMSNVSNIRMSVQTAGGTYKSVGIAQTGSCTRDGDTCNHYRFEVESAEYYISPTLYVTPMGRDVQFYIKLNTATAQPGTGNFTSQTATQASQEISISSAPETSTAVDTENVTTEEATTQEVDAQESGATEAETELIDKEKTESEDNKKKETKMTSQTKSVSTKNNKKWIIIGIVAAIVLLVGGVGGYWYYKRKRNQNEENHYFY